MPEAPDGQLAEEATVQDKQGVLDRLNTIITAELTATHLYLLQVELCRHWGYERLYDRLHNYSREELEDAEHLIAHILYLDGAPNLQGLGRVQAGEGVQALLQMALDSERSAVALYAEAITHCAEVEDYTTRSMLEEAVRSEEEQLDWLETQVATIGQIGLQNYLAQQIHATG